MEKETSPNSYRETLCYEPDPAINRLRVNPELGS